MKLWKKTVALMLLTLFCALGLVSGLTIYTAADQNIENFAQTCARQTALAAEMLNQFWDSGKYDRMSETGRKSYLNFQFQQCCGQGFALLQDGEVLENMTGYKILDADALGETEKGTVSAYKIQRLNGKYLMMQQTAADVIENGRLFSIRDMTDVYEKIRRLGISILVINGFVFLVSGLFIYQMMKRTVRRMEELQEVAGRQEMLLGALAHEMKTPLTSIIGYSDSLLHVNLTQEQQKKALMHVNREGRRMEKLSAKMLQMMGLYKNEAVKMETCSVKELILHVTETELDNTEKRGIVLETEYEDFTMKMDTELMESLLLNLIDNAVHASKPGDTVILRAMRKDGAKLFQVEDFGCGIPEEETKRVKEAFYMVDKSRSRRNGGAGLGLALCEKITELHHGKLEITSEPGRGTIVTARFP